MINRMNNSVQIAYNSESSLAEIKVNWLKWAIIFGFWTLFSVLYANQIYFEMLHQPGMNHSWFRIVFWQLLVWYAWGCLSPLVLMLGRRYPLEAPRLWRAVLLHIVAALVFAAFHGAVETSLKMLIEPFDVWSDHRPFLLQYESSLRNFFVIDVLVYWSILGFGYAFDYRLRYRERASMAAQLKAQLAQAQLESLKMQLHPHFLFNTLHTIAGLVRSNESRPAVDMIAGLSDLLRHALENVDEQEVTLRDEVKFVELYLGIQKVRFSDRLKVRIDAAEETLDALVPNLILQPLVENAIRHGISMKDSAGSIVIETYRDDEMLHIRVCDDGPGLQAGWRVEDSGGIGLSNTRARLSHLYGANHRFELRNGESGGMTVTIALPLRFEGEFRG
jgi:two-component system, LytTR family, sensor kinase